MDPYLGTVGVGERNQRSRLLLAFRKTSESTQLSTSREGNTDHVFTIDALLLAPHLKVVQFLVRTPPLEPGCVPT